VGFNQAKGKDLFGKFIENELKIADLVKNTEVIYYMYNDDQELIGINKTICSSIRLTFEDSDIEDITFFTNPDGDIFPETELPESSRKLKGFVWRGEERIRSKEEIFDEDDNSLDLPVIRGVDNPIDTDTDAATSKLEKKARDYVNSSNPKAIPVPAKNNQQVEAANEKQIEVIRGQPDIKPGFYLIANVFENEENFSRFARMLSDRGIEPRSFVRERNQYTYVYLDRYDTEAEAREARDSQYFGKYTDEIWILRVVGN
jgi:hypothetical protein